MALLLFSLFVPVLTGFLLLCLIWPDKGKTGAELLIKFSLAIGLGFGFSSVLFFVWLLSPASSANGLWIVELGLLIVLMAALGYRTRRRDYITFSGFPPNPVKELGLYRILPLSFFVVFAFSVFSLIYLSLINPHGIWDAWAIWNLRARFIFRAGPNWTAAFTGLLDWSHPDYPLLLPGIIARCWSYIGRETQLIPIIISISFFLATTGLIVSSLSVLRSKSQGFLAGLVLLAAPSFIASGANQIADLPIGFFFLATMVLFCLQGRLGEKDGFLFLAGATAGLSAWTKNEGILFLISIILARLITVVPARGRRIYFRQMLFLWPDSFRY